MSLRIKSMAELPFIHRSTLSSPDVMVAKPRKYRNTPVVEDGQRFDSKLEAACYRELMLRHAAGEVKWFVRQAAFRLEGGVIYRADFLVVLAPYGVEVIDAKGVLTQASANKIKQVEARYGVKVQLWKGKA